MNSIKPEQYSKEDLNRFLSQLIGDVANKARIDALSTSVHAFYIDPLLREISSLAEPVHRRVSLIGKLKAFFKRPCK